jgi:cation:H+ antiporter
MSLLWLAVVLTLPGIVMKLSGFDAHHSPLTGLFVFGMTIVSAAFLLTWAAETAEGDLGSGLAIVLLALVTVLPEYAVDVLLAWKAGTDEHARHLALGNMTGANRLLIGVGWPLVAMLVWYREGRSGITLRRERSGDIVWLLVATAYSCIIPLKGTLAWYDAVVLFAIYAIYVKGSASDEGEGHDAEELVGPPRVMMAWPKRRRLVWTTWIFLWSAGAILASAEPFVESIMAAGDHLHIDSFVLAQWIAPLASEAPEFVVVILLTMRGRAEMGLGAFISSKVNQWTLLVGAVPLAYGLSRLKHGFGFETMPIDPSQVEELWLTAAQGLYAVAAISDLNFSLRQAMTILVLFLVQFVGSIGVRAFGGADAHHALMVFHNALSILYGVLALRCFLIQRRDLVQRWRDCRAVPKGAALAPAPDRGGAGGPDESDA